MTQLKSTVLFMLAKGNACFLFTQPNVNAKEGKSCKDIVATVPSSQLKAV